MHPPRSTWDAYLDRELPPAQLGQLWWHARRCATCRVRLFAARAERDALTIALAPMSVVGRDVAAAWRVVQERAETRVPARRAVRLRYPLVAAIAAAVLVAVGVGVRRRMQGLARATPQEQASLQHLKALIIGDALAIDSNEVSPAGLAHALETMQHGDVRLRDVCCADHDGGGPADDGLLTVNIRDQHVSIVLVYEDVDHNGVLSAGDIVRFVSEAPQGRPRGARPGARG